MDDIQRMRHNILKRYSAGEIDRDEYEWARNEVDRLESDAAGAPGHGSETPLFSDAAEICPGMVLGGYTIKRLIGKGGMGEVWLASEEIRDSNFFSVIKLLLPSDATEEETKRLLATFHKVRLLQHEHICPVYSIGFDQRVGYYFVMKYVEAMTLSSRAKDPDAPLTTSDSLKVLTAVSSALDYSHARGIIHRDMKPTNIMVNDDLTEMQVVDFGLAARVDAVTQNIKGSPGYMAPEQWMAEKQDGRTDQFALAVVAYELFGGSRPFTGNDVPFGFSLSGNDLSDAVLAPRPVKEVLCKALSPNRVDRFETCTAFVEQLRCAVTLNNGDC